METVVTEVRIYRPAKNAMQSGRGNTQKWIVEFEPAAPKYAEPLMGWVGSVDTQSQVKLKFDSKEEAIAYCERENLRFRVFDDKPARAVQPKSYSDNFAYNRVRG